jgi:hypothetical protein
VTLYGRGDDIVMPEYRPADFTVPPPKTGNVRQCHGYTSRDLLLD